MKKILRGPTVFRVKCPRCDHEFSYTHSELTKIWSPGPNFYRKVEYYIECQNCHGFIEHDENLKSDTSFEISSTMST